jgi:hypothetical protein
MKLIDGDDGADISHDQQAIVYTSSRPGAIVQTHTYIYCAIRGVVGECCDPHWKICKTTCKTPALSLPTPAAVSPSAAGRVASL